MVPSMTWMVSVPKGTQPRSWYQDGSSAQRSERAAPSLAAFVVARSRTAVPRPWPWRSVRVATEPTSATGTSHEGVIRVRASHAQVEVGSPSVSSTSMCPSVSSPKTSGYSAASGRPSRSTFDIRSSAASSRVML